MGQERLKEIYFRAFVSFIESTIYEILGRGNVIGKLLTESKCCEGGRGTLKWREGRNEIKKYILRGAQFHPSNDRSFVYITIHERERGNPSSRGVWRRRRRIYYRRDGKERSWNSSWRFQCGIKMSCLSDRPIYFVFHYLDLFSGTCINWKL